MQRIIAYIYRYKSEGEILTKCGNVGFCRVEEVNGSRIINMCFKETRNIDRECKIKSLSINKEKSKDVCGCSSGNEIGKYEIKGGQMRLKLKGDKEDGLILETSDDKYVVIWSGDKETLHIINVEESKKNEQNREKEQSREIDININKIMSNDIKDKTIAGDIHKIVANMEIKKEQKENINLYNMLERAYNRMAKVPMIIDGHMQQAVKLQPQQMIMLPRKYWRLTNNGFLMECFYIHKHILFFKYKGSFVIGAPARETVDEEMYAERYGFQGKITIKEYGKGGCDRGYWIIHLN